MSAYCNDPLFGPSMKSNCTKTCGLCTNITVRAKPAGLCPDLTMPGLPCASLLRIGKRNEATFPDYCSVCLASTRRLIICKVASEAGDLQDI